MNKNLIQEIIFLVIRIAIIAVIIVACIKAIPKFTDMGYRIFADEAIDPAPGITKTVAIVDGKSDKEIGDILEEKGLIKDAFLFKWQVKFSEYDGMLKPGNYKLSTGMTPYEMMAVMAHVGEEETEEYVDETYEEAKDAATLWDEADDVAGNNTSADSAGENTGEQTGDGE